MYIEVYNYEFPEGCVETHYNTSLYSSVDILDILFLEGYYYIDLSVSLINGA